MRFIRGGDRVGFVKKPGRPWAASVPRRRVRPRADASVIVDELLPVRLVGTAGEGSVESGVARSVSLILHGVLRLEADQVILEWSGMRRVAEAGLGVARSVAEPVPVSRAVLPVASLGRVALRRHWWWRWRLVLGSADLAALQSVPTAQSGQIVLEVARADRHTAADLVSRIELAAADHALAAAERLQALPGASD